MYGRPAPLPQPQGQALAGWDKEGGGGIGMLLDRFIDQTSDAELKVALESASLIICDNVAAYFYEENPRENWNLVNDFPNVAPPFSRMFLEWAAPRRIVSEKYGDIKVPGTIKRYGLLLFSDEVESIDEMIEWAKQRGQDWQLQLFRKIKHTGFPLRWVCNGLLFVEDAQGIGLLCDAMWGVSNDGSPVMPDNIFTVKVLKGLDDGRLVTGLFFVPFLTLSFMHCKNAILRQVAQPPKLQKARLRKGKRPLIIYHVLEVHPIRKILESEGEAHKTGFKKALHICRGHFKDYMEGPGLFGKIHDIFWWDAHIRGDKKCGMALKDYEVESE